MNIYAQLLDNSKVGAKVGFTYEKGKAIAGAKIDHGRFGVVKSINQGVAFIEVLSQTSAQAVAESGSGVGVTIELPIVAKGYLSVTVEDD